MPTKKMPYVGRFAPSPTGHLHFGSLVTAVASYLDARAHQGTWLLRIEDIDETRCHIEDERAIMRTLERFGFIWDGPVVRQSERKALYREVFEDLLQRDLVYPCGCSRKELSQGKIGIDGGIVYAGTCAHGLPPGKTARAWRMRVTDAPITVNDCIQASQVQHLSRDVGDFVVKRADGLFAYQLAVVVDDIIQGVNHIVRGADLLDSTARQMWLYQCLHAQVPVYAHVPLAINQQGEKLSKQTKATPVDDWPIIATLLQVFAFLNLPVTHELEMIELDALWQWAIAHWSIENVPKMRQQSFHLSENCM